MLCLGQTKGRVPRGAAHPSELQRKRCWMSDPDPLSVGGANPPRPRPLPNCECSVALRAALTDWGRGHTMSGSTNTRSTSRCFPWTVVLKCVRTVPQGGPSWQGQRASGALGIMAKHRWQKRVPCCRQRSWAGGRSNFRSASCLLAGTSAHRSTNAPKAKSGDSRGCAAGSRLA